MEDPKFVAYAISSTTPDGLVKGLDVFLSHTVIMPSHSVDSDEEVGTASYPSLVHNDRIPSGRSMRLHRYHDIISQLISFVSQDIDIPILGPMVLGDSTTEPKTLTVKLCRDSSVNTRERDKRPMSTTSSHDKPLIDSRMDSLPDLSLDGEEIQPSEEVVHMHQLVSETKKVLDIYLVLFALIHRPFA